MACYGAGAMAVSSLPSSASMPVTFPSSYELNPSSSEQYSLLEEDATKIIPRLPSQAEISGNDLHWIGARRRGRRRGCRNRTLAEREAQVEVKRSDKNTKERVRVGNINRMYQKLRKQLGDPHPEKRLCKLRVLNAAIQHIHDLMDIVKKRQNRQEINELIFQPQDYEEDQPPVEAATNSEGESSKNEDLERQYFLNSMHLGSPPLIDEDMERMACVHHQQVLPELTYHSLPCGSAPPNLQQPFLLESSMVPVSPQMQCLPMPPSCYYHPLSEYSIFSQNNHHHPPANMISSSMPSLGTTEENALLHQLGSAKFPFPSSEFDFLGADPP